MLSHFSEMRPRVQGRPCVSSRCQKQEGQQLAPCQVESEATLTLTSDFAYHKLSKENKDGVHGQSHKNKGKLASSRAATEATSEFQQMAYAAFSVSKNCFLSQ